MEWLTADCERCNSLAAAVKLPMRATRTKATSCLVSRTSFNHESSSCMQSKQTNARIGPEKNAGIPAACRTRVKANPKLKRGGSPSSSSADLQSAVSPNSIRRIVEHFESAEDRNRTLPLLHPMEERAGERRIFRLDRFELARSSVLSPLLRRWERKKGGRSEKFARPVSISDRLKICATTCPPGLSRRQFLGKTAKGLTLGALFAGLPRAWVGTAYASDAPETTRMRFGMIALTDCSPIVIAHENGLFKKYGIESTVAKS